MIYFITNRVHLVDDPNITILNNFDLFHEYISKLDEIGFDKEFNGLNEIYAIPLLTAVGDKENQFVIDDTCFPRLDYLTPYLKKLFIGHNIKIDIKVARKQGVDIRNVYDTMIVEQRLGMDSERSNTLEETYRRRCFKVMPEGKAIRDSFSTMNTRSQFISKQIKYAAGDIHVLFDIKKEQARLIEKFDYNHLLYNVELPLIPILADGELEGFLLDEDKWLYNIQENKRKQLEIERELDKELVRLNLFSYKADRQVQEVVQTSLFPTLIEEKVSSNLNKGRINYGSSKAVLELFTRLNIPKPRIEQKEKNKITGVKETKIKEGVGEDALNAYLLAYPKTPMRKFIEKLIEHKGVTKNISSFGMRFLKTDFRTKGGIRKLGYKNRITGKVHTIYRQCMSKTGRLQSGDEKNGFYNSQQIPTESAERNGKKEAIYRTPFTLSKEEIEDDWWISTADLTGAEAVIMCAFAKDEILKKWAVEEDDLHSPMATLCYRALYGYRKRKGKPLIVKDSYLKEYALTEDIVINKHNNKQLRADFKSVTFGVIYGAGAKTIAKTLNVPEEEAKIIVEAISSTLSATIAYVKKNAAFALEHGYLVLNNRTKSRKYFAAKFRGSVSREEAIKIEQEARNAAIQGTQADLLKEAMVEIDRYFRANNIPNCFLLQVHDELVWKVKGKENAKHVGRIMSEVATKYLNGYAVMNTEQDILTHWTK